MSVLDVVKVYDNNLYLKTSCLRKKCEIVSKDEINAKWLKELISDMLETLYSGPAGVGLSANQVGVLSQIIVVDIKRDAKSPLVLLNPTYTPITNELINSHEVCISVPNKSAVVPRYKKIEFTYMDLKGNLNTQIAEGFKASVIQHEIDHLNGKLYIDLVNEVDQYIGYSATKSKQAFNKLMEENV